MGHPAIGIQVGEKLCSPSEAGVEGKEQGKGECSWGEYETGLALSLTLLSIFVSQCLLRMF